MTVDTAVDVGTILAEAFRENIEMMFGLPLEGPKEGSGDEHMTMSGMVGLGGPEFRGLLQIACTDQGARKLAATLLGGEEMLGDDPAMIADGLGELANLVGGAIKRHLDESGGNIELSLPSVLEGEGNLLGVSNSERVTLRWIVDGEEVETSLVYTVNGS